MCYSLIEESVGAAGSHIPVRIIEKCLNLLCRVDSHDSPSCGEKKKGEDGERGCTIRRVEVDDGDVELSGCLVCEIYIFSAGMRVGQHPVVGVPFRGEKNRKLLKTKSFACFFPSHANKRESWRLFLRVGSFRLA